MSQVMHHPTKGQKLAGSDAETNALYRQGWRDNPGKFGLETCPGESPDPKIEAAGKKYRAENASAEAAATARQPEETP